MQLKPAYDEYDEGRKALAEKDLEKALAPDVHFVDPSIDLVGIDAFEANVHRVHEQVPGAVYSRTSDVDGHHGHHRYHWAIHMNDELLMPGFDVTEINDAGKVVRIIGFFGEMDR